jgi:hypothetical protein
MVTKGIEYGVVLMGDEKMTQQTQYPEQPSEIIKQAQQEQRWYRRAGTKVKRAARKALLPAAITLAAAGVTLGAFQAGRYYTAFQGWGGLEDTLVEVKSETRVVRRYGRIYIEKKYEAKRQIDPSQSKLQLLMSDDSI